jgi:hypothetical protein
MRSVMADAETIVALKKLRRSSAHAARGLVRA